MDTAHHIDQDPEYPITPLGETALYDLFPNAYDVIEIEK